MNTPAQKPAQCVYDVLLHATDATAPDDARWNLRCDAECQREGLLDALSFIGTAMQDCTNNGGRHPFSQADLNHLSSFLINVPDLIRGLTTIVEFYEEPTTAADRQEARHV